jgi:hypothetical protein
LSGFALIWFSVNQCIKVRLSLSKLLINKLDAYGVSESALKLIKHYLSNRKHCVKIGNIMSEWENIYKGVPQDSIYASSLFINNLWGRQSKAFDKSMRMAATNLVSSRAFFQSSIIFRRAVWQP